MVTLQAIKSVITANGKYNPGSVFKAKDKDAVFLIKSGAAVEIEVDGGVIPANSKELVAAGADILVAGSAVFKDPENPDNPDYAGAIARLR